MISKHNVRKNKLYARLDQRPELVREKTNRIMKETWNLIEYFKPHIDELCEDCAVRLEKNPLRILDCKVDAGSEILEKAPRISEYLNEESKERFNKMNLDFEVVK